MFSLKRDRFLYWLVDTHWCLSVINSAIINSVFYYELAIQDIINFQHIHPGEITENATYWYVVSGLKEDLDTEL